MSYEISFLIIILIGIIYGYYSDMKSIMSVGLKLAIPLYTALRIMCYLLPSFVRFEFGFWGLAFFSIGVLSVVYIIFRHIFNFFLFFLHATRFGYAAVCIRIAAGFFWTLLLINSLNLTIYVFSSSPVFPDNTELLFKILFLSRSICSDSAAGLL